MENLVYILMATYNGEQYLGNQFESIIGQTYKNWKLIVCDDVSTDSTVAVIKKYAEIDKRISYYVNKINLRPLRNFGRLVGCIKKQDLSDDTLIMFCDQDDVWKRDKIEKSVKAILKYDMSKPLLVYTGKEYVDSNLLSVKYVLQNENKLGFRYNLHQNQTYGCTYIINKVLLDTLVEKPEEFFCNYDHYVLIQALIYGSVHFLEEKTIFYRQHENNVSGSILNRKLKEKFKVFNKYKRNVEQYKCIIVYCYNHLQKISLPADKKLINSLYKYRNNRFLLVIYSIFYGVRKNTLLATLQFYLVMLFNVGIK